jgi:uncharacterized membrane protein YciS (DUF1049 family)
VLRRIVAAIILIPLAIIIVAFAVANRHQVTISFDPFAADEPAASVTLPLFALVIILLIFGVLLGGLATWLGQGKWRGAARRFERELQHLRNKIAALEGRAAPTAKAPSADDAPERLRLRPPVR